MSISYHEYLLLKSPCVHRGLNIRYTENKKVEIDGAVFDSIIEAEKFLINIPRIDIKNINWSDSKYER
jgi:hypothetical protein